LLDEDANGALQMNISFTTEEIRDFVKQDECFVEQFSAFNNQLDEFGHAFQASATEYQEQLGHGVLPTIKIQLPILLQANLEADYRTAYYLQSHLILSRTWRGNLNKEVMEMNRQYPRHSGYAYILAVKTLLLSNKREIFLKQYQSFHSNPELVLAALWKNLVAAHRTAKSVRELLDRLQANLAEVRSDITRTEAGLKKYCWPQALVANGMYIWKESFYFGFTKVYFDYVNNDLLNDQRIRAIPILSTKLSPEYVTFFTVLGSVGLVGAELKWIGRMGPASSFVSLVIKKFLLSDIERIAKLCGARHEDGMVQALPYIEHVLDLAAYACLYSTFFGFNPLAIGMIALSRLVTGACQNLVGSLLDRLGSSRVGVEAKKSWNTFVKLPVQLVTGFISNYVTFRFVPNFFQHRQPVSDEKLIGDKELCLQDRERCRKLALRIFDLPQNATATEIRHAYRKFALENHPDKFLPDRKAAMETAMSKANDGYSRLGDLGALR